MTGESSWYIFLSSPNSLLPDDFSCQQLQYLFIRKSDKGERQADISGKLMGDDRFMLTNDRLHPVKQINRTGDDVFHLFRAVVTLRINHIAGAAVQTHFRRLQCLGFSFFSLLFVLSMNKKARQYCMSGIN